MGATLNSGEWMHVPQSPDCRCQMCREWSVNVNHALFEWYRQEQIKRVVILPIRTNVTVIDRGAK